MLGACIYGEVVEKQPFFGCLLIFIRIQSASIQKKKTKKKPHITNLLTIG